MDTSILPTQQTTSSAAELDQAAKNSDQRKRVFNPDRSVEKVDQTGIDSILRRGDSEVVPGNRTVEFSFDDDANRVVVKVKSPDGDTVRQIPPDEYLKFVAKFKEMVGVLFDEKA